jgi:hypothetical protein
MPRQASSEEIASQVRGVFQLSRDELIERWTEAYGRPPPKGTSRRLLERSAAYHLQVAAFGGLRPSVIRRLLAGGNGGERRKFKSGSVRCRLSPGTRLLREWNGRSHVVEVTESGFQWNGQSWRSLSAVATAITGARWSGPRFFGL